MLGMGWSEIMVIMVVAVVVISPKNLPAVIKSVSGFMKTAKDATASVKETLYDVADETEINTIKESLTQQKSYLETEIQDLHNQVATEYKDLKHMDLNNTDLNDTDLNNTDLNDTDLNDTDLNDTDLDVNITKTADVTDRTPIKKSDSQSPAELSKDKI